MSIPVRCYTCGTLQFQKELAYRNGINEIEKKYKKSLEILKKNKNDLKKKKLNKEKEKLKEQKKNELTELVKELFPLYCCRGRVGTHIDRFALIQPSKIVN